MVRGLAVLFVLAVAVLSVMRLDEFTRRSSEDVSDSVESSSETVAYGPRRVALQADGRGHFIVDAVINGRTVRMMADTGASAVALTATDARRVGIEPRSLTFDIPIQTANGSVHVAGVMLKRVDVGGIVFDDVEAMVASDEALGSSLLGMTFLGRLGSVNLSGDTLELVE